MKSLLCIIILVCLTACHTQKAEKTESADVFWQGASAGYKLLWTNQDFTYEKNGKRESLFKWLAEVEEDIKCKMYENNEPDTKCGCHLPGHCVYKYRYRLLSVYGSFVSFEIEYDGWAGKDNYPARSFTVITFDLSKDKYAYKQYREGLSREYRSSKANDLIKKPNILIGLDKLFDGKLILRELLEHEDIYKGLVEDEVDIKKLATASDLAKPIGLAGFARFYLYRHDIPFDYLTRFSFYDITKDGVVVEISFPYTRRESEINNVLVYNPYSPFGQRGYPRRIRISLPESSIIKEFLPSADPSFDSLLQKDAEIRFGEKTTEFIYEY